jgi:hypothetical protein
LVTTPGALLSDLGIGRSVGLVIRGAGRNVTNIVFSPISADQYLVDNNDDWLHVTFEGINFHSTVATASFMKSTSSGGAQNYSFVNCTWGGTWKYGVHLLGTNTNSEMSWYHCGISGSWTAFLYSPDPSSGGSDQFLNYNFFATNNEVSAGNFIDMASGGNINVFGGSMIHIGNGTETGSSNQVFFRLRTSNHSRGVQRLHVEGIRVEHRHQNSQLIVSDWLRGNISFVSCDTESHASFRTTPASCITADFTNFNVQPIISFKDCSLMGVHRYQYDLNSHQRRYLITYRDCDISNWTTASQFISYVNSSGSTNPAGQPMIKFERCRGSASDNTELFDCNLGYHQHKIGEGERRIVSLRTPQNASPSTASTPSTIIVKLPLNAVITKVRGNKPAGGAATSTNFAYTITDADAGVVATIAGDGTTAWNAGFNYASADLFRRLTTDNQRTLTLTPTNIAETSTLVHFWIEYVA